MTDVKAEGIISPVFTIHLSMYVLNVITSNFLRILIKF